MRALLRAVVFAFALASAPSSAKDLSAMSADEVLSLQQRLIGAGCYSGALDGRVGPTLEAAKKACPDQDPVLRIETGMHTAAIRSMGVDNTCRLAATGSHDKTVRLWSLPDGRLIRTQRLPIGAGDAGKVFAIAVSPDGRWVAAGGLDASFALNRQITVYLFDSATGTPIRRLGAFGSGVARLAVSTDGRRLAVGLQGKEGVRVLEVASGRELMADRDYADHSYGVAFGLDGALYVAAYDGYLRRYDPDLQRSAKVETPGGKQPGAIAVNPAGGPIAVAYVDTKAIDLFEPTSLRHVGEADTKDINNTYFSALAWSADGQRLAAGGSYQKFISGTWRRLVRFFDRDGQRLGSDLPVANDTISSLTTCRDAIAFAAADPSFGLIDANGVTRILGSPRTADMRNKRGDAFTVSPDGMRLRFGLGVGLTRPILFDLGGGTITDAPILPGDLRMPDVESLKVDGWRATPKPAVDGKPLVLQPYERAESLAVRPDRTGFALGSDFTLRGFAADGKQRWSVATPANAWGVNFARDGDLVLAADGDGTVRWHRWSDGKELLALFIHADDRRWVAWTPTGYYTASPGAEELIGWHVNRGWEQPADFFPASRFRERFNRPDIVALVLQTLDEDVAVKRANEAAGRKEDTKPLISRLPPVIRITSPTADAPFSSNQFTLGYELRSPSGIAVDGIDVRVDGSLLQRGTGVPPACAGAFAPSRANTGAACTGTLALNLPQHSVEIALIARAADLASEPARVRLTWSGAAPSGEALLKPKLYALVIGVSAYVAPGLMLGYAAKDARDFAKALDGQRGGMYGEVETRIITDRDVTRTSVVEGLEWLEKQVTSRDVGIVFIAGHGYMDEKQTYWFLPADATPEHLRATAVAQDDITRTLRSLAGKALLLLDTCHAAGVFAGGGTRRGTVDINMVINEFSATENGVIAFASSTGREVSVESAAWQNGAFTKAIIEGLRDGRADLLGKGTITLSELDAYVVNRVKTLTDGAQHPVMTRPPTVPDFPIALVRR